MFNDNYPGKNNLSKMSSKLTAMQNQFINTKCCQTLQIKNDSFVKSSFFFFQLYLFSVPRHTYTFMIEDPDPDTFTLAHTHTHTHTYTYTHRVK